MSIKKLLKIILIFGIIGFSITLFFEPLYTPTAISSPNHLNLLPKYIAKHAMVSKEFTGNTIQSVQDSLSSYVDAIEVDVRISKDHVLFLFTDEILDKVTNSKGKPEEQKWSELEKTSYTDQVKSKILNLEELFKYTGSQKFIILNIKDQELLNLDLAQQLINLIHKYNLEERVIIDSVNPLLLTTLRWYARDILLIYSFRDNNNSKELTLAYKQATWLLQQSFLQKQVRRIVRPDALGIDSNITHRSLLKLLKQGYPVFISTVDEPTKAKEFFDIGVKGIKTNNFAELIKQQPATNYRIYDAGGTFTKPFKIIHVNDSKDIINAIQEAKALHKKISIAGRRHSMGGQSLMEDSIQLDMLALDTVAYNEKTTNVTVGAGATWKKVQNILNEHNRSVIVMQSDNIFTTGGSVSVNVHGWQANKEPLASTIVSMNVITAEGVLKNISATKEPELFKAVIGGYGMFAVIVDIEFQTTTNSSLVFNSKFMPPVELVSCFKQFVTSNPKTELAYARLSIDKQNLFAEAGLFWYETVTAETDKEIKAGSLIALKRGILRSSEYLELGKKLRWEAEKIYAKQMNDSYPISRNNAMNSDIHLLWPLYGSNKDILHEYFVPREKLHDFIIALKTVILKHDINVLNVTIREVNKDNISLLSYAQQDVFALVCLFSQQQTLQDEESMQMFTTNLIDETLKLNGTFYLPYRLHYTQEQLQQSYPKLESFLTFKNKADPENIFYSEFFKNIKY